MFGRHESEEDRREREEIRLLKEIRDGVNALVAHFVPTATTIVLSTGGSPMATTATGTFATDSTGTTPAPPPKGDGSGLVVTFSSDNPAVTLGASTASGDIVTAAITGTEAFNLSCVVANQSGAELLDDNGTPFVQAPPLAVAAGTAVATTIVLSTS